MGRWFSRQEKEEERFILSIDGGGIRGLVPSVLLRHMAEELKEKGDRRPLYSHFDLIAGTSTGSLLALGMTLEDTAFPKEEGADCPATHIARTGFFRKTEVTDGYIPRTADPSFFQDQYIRSAKGIFKPRSSLFGPAFSDKYDSSSFESWLMETFRENTLSQCLVPTLCVAYDCMGGHTEVLSSWNGWKDMKARDAARSSCAAPMYFSPFYTNSPDGNRAALLDGGLVANNPALVAYSEARRLYPDCRRFHILSLSTVRGIYIYNPKENLNGLAGWAEPVMKIYPNAQMDLVFHTLSSLPDVDYLRIEGASGKEKIKMDDTRIESMTRLVETGERLYEENRENIDSFVDRLSTREDFSHVRLAERRLLP